MDVMLGGGGGGSGDNVHMTLCVEKSICESSLRQIQKSVIRKRLAFLMYLMAVYMKRATSVEWEDSKDRGPRFI